MRVLTAGLLLLLAGPAVAQQPPPLDRDQLLDYAWIYSQPSDYVAYSGVQSGAQNTNFLTIPISIWLKRLPCCGNPITPEIEGRTTGIRLRLTSVIGFAEFDSISQFNASSVQLGAIYPGIELLFKTGELSMLRPFIDVGVGTTSADSTRIAFGRVGLRTEFVFPWKTWELGVEPRLSGSYVLTDIADADLSNVSISSKVDARYPLGFTIAGKTPDIGAYFEPSWFPVPATFQTNSGEQREVDFVGEIGFTVGFRYLAPMICGLFRMPRLGIGWRFGKDINGIQIRIGGDRVTRLPLP